MAGEVEFASQMLGISTDIDFNDIVSLGLYYQLSNISKPVKNKIIHMKWFYVDNLLDIKNIFVGVQ